MMYHYEEQALNVIIQETNVVFSRVVVDQPGPDVSGGWVPGGDLCTHGENMKSPTERSVL